MNKNAPYVNYDSQSDVLYIAMGEGMEEEYVEVAQRYSGRQSFYGPLRCPCFSG